MIGIIDYGMGNLYSVRNAFLSLGVKAEIIANPEQLKKLDSCILPGVGAFGDAMRILNKTKLTQAIKDYIKTGKVFMGICLGLQLLFDSSEESPNIKGLGVVRGSVTRFKGNIKIPQIGWNQIKIRNKNCHLFKGVKDNSFVYFCHSYYIKPKENNIIAADTNYGIDFVSVIAKDNIFGIQFHPEKSQSIGLKILENFVKRN